LSLQTPSADLLRSARVEGASSLRDRAAGFAYLGEDVFILALADEKQGDFAGTGEKVAQQRTSIPHLWSGVTVYLAALAIYEPERFSGQRPPPP